MKNGRKKAKLCYDLALLVAVGEYLEAVGSDGKKLDIVVRQQRHHLLQSTGVMDGHLSTVLM